MFTQGVLLLAIFLLDLLFLAVLLAWRTPQAPGEHPAPEAPPSSPTTPSRRRGISTERRRTFSSVCLLAFLLSAAALSGADRPALLFSPRSGSTA